MDPGTKVPVIYELDDGEANGIVHPFCSESCRSAESAKVDSDAASRGFRTAQGFDDGMDSQSKCEHCGHFIYRC